MTVAVVVVDRELDEATANGLCHRGFEAAIATAGHECHFAGPSPIQKVEMAIMVEVSRLGDERVKAD